MTDSNRVRVAMVRETTAGTLPGSPRMRTARYTRESLKWVPSFFTPEEVRADRMTVDPTKVNEINSGGIDSEFSFPTDNKMWSQFLEMAMANLWNNAPVRYNDGVADSVITAITVTTNVVTVTTGTAFAVGHLVRHTNFGIAGNNGIFKVTTGGTTSYTCSAGAFATEAAPPAEARAKVVGFQGTAADITATATGLGATTLNFTTLGLAVGQWIKIGGTAAGDRFATTACNAWCRITAIAATALTLDNLPAAWTTDSGTGKTIKVWFGDVLKNGTTLITASIERAHMDQAVPTYILQTGMGVDELTINAATEKAVTGSIAFMGMNGSQGTSANGASYDGQGSEDVITANADIGNIVENGLPTASPNWTKSISFNLKNNLRMLTAVGSVGAVALGMGEFMASGNIETFFGSNALLARLLAGTRSSIAMRTSLGVQNVIFSAPRVTFTDGSPNSGGKSQDVTLPLSWTAAFDNNTNSAFQIDRFEYAEN